MKARFPALFACLLAAAAALPGQTTTQPAGVLIPTQNNAQVNGVKIQVAPDGAVWFLESSADIIARYKDGVTRQWQIRPTSQLGANPVDFELDGDVVWLIESGQSQIPAGTCAYAKLDTTTNQLTEWVIPGTIPAAFYRAPDGLVWLPQSGAVLQSFDPNTLQVVNYRSPRTYAYADMAVAPDGALWLADFGDNRIVRWVPGAETETSWTFWPVASGRLNPSQIQFDDKGSLWITQRGSAIATVNRVDRFDPATNNLYSYENITNPIHFDIFQGRLYITQITSTSQITVLDPALAQVSQITTIVPETLSVGSSPSTRQVTIRNTTIVPTDFTSAPADIGPSEFTVTNPGTTAGLLTTTFPSAESFAISVVGGRVWTGTTSKLAAINLQAAGAAADLAVPMASTLSGAADSKIRIETTVGNRGAAGLSGQILFLDSPGSFAPRATFTLAANATSLLSDTFGNLTTTPTYLYGPVRLGTTSGTATDLAATVRSVRVLPDGGTFGYLFPAEFLTTSLPKDSATTLFTGASDSQISILTLYSLDDARATLGLYGPDGTLRGTQDFSIAKNASLVFNPAASAFGAAAEPGDVVRTSVTSGTLQASVLVYDTTTTDIFPAPPAVAAAGLVIPWVGSYANGDRSMVTDLYLSNPSADTAADVSISYVGVGATGTPPSATLTLPPGTSQAVSDVLSTLFAIPAGQGALTLSSSTPIAASARIATRVGGGDYGTFASAMDATGGVAGGQSAYTIALPETATRTGYLLLYNSGGAGTVSIAGFKGDGSPAGPLTVEMEAQSAAVVGPVFASMGVTNQGAGRVRVDVPDGMTLFGWAAAADLVTGDIDITPLR